MSYRIVVDSCCELPDIYKNDEHFISIPLELQIGDKRIKDDKNFDQAECLREVAECPDCPRSSCPDPEAYMEAYASDAEDIYVVTISSKLSGSYNSAVLAASLYEEEMEEEFGPRNIHVIDSKSASAAETQIALKLFDMMNSGLAFDQVIPLIEAYRDSVSTFFVIDNLDTFIKNGRIHGIKAAVATTLSVKPILGGDDGEIVQLGQALGMKKAITKMADLIISGKKSMEGRRIIISNCNCPDRAETVALRLAEVYPNTPVIHLNTGGVSTLYANDGGIIVTL